jgi:hypothetical protein
LLRELFHLSGRVLESPQLAATLRVERFHSCCTPKPLLPSGIFLKEMPPFEKPEMAGKLWNRSRT